MSTPKFRKALEDEGVEIEMKVSPTTGKETPAFAKTDQFMETLGEHPNPRVQALVAARLGLKSTIEETRTEKLISISQLPWQVSPDGMPRLYQGGGTMPIPLRYGGAHTHRLSGDWKMNMQNMPTARGSGGKSKLRQSLCAPPGYTVIVADLGQIEARLVAWISSCVLLMDQFANKKDPYNALASTVFGRPVNRKLVGTIDEIMGFIGKTGILGLGYGAGKDKFDTMVIQSARKMGVDISAIYTRAIGDKAVDAYRTMYREIPNTWALLDMYLRTVWLNGAKPVHFGPVTIEQGSVLLPNMMRLNYDQPSTRPAKRTLANGRVIEEQELIYRYGKLTHKIYGAKFLENIVQALARIVVMNAALRIRCRGFGMLEPDAYRFVLQAHDELVFIVPDAEVDYAKKIIHEEMIRRPSWAPDLPLTADVGSGRTYGEAK
jgi:DNA polymerase